jgi:hypothetical protein
MLEQHKGLYALTGNGPYRMAVDLTDTVLTIGLFKGIDEGMVDISFDVLAAHIRSSPRDGGRFDPAYVGFVISDLPGSADLFVYLGRVSLDMAGARGKDELVDYSRIEFTCTNDGQLNTWENRLIRSRFDKNELGVRYRAKGDLTHLCFIWMPIMTGSLADTRIILIGDPYSHIRLGETPLPRSIDSGDFPSNSRGYLDFYWSANTPIDLTVPAGGSLTVPIQLIENADSSDLAYAATLKLEEVSGFAPKKRVRIGADGSAEVLVYALGLSPGDLLDIKINTDHYTGIGRIQVAVV